MGGKRAKCVNCIQRKYKQIGFNRETTNLITTTNKAACDSDDDDDDGNWRMQLTKANAYRAPFYITGIFINRSFQKIEWEKVNMHCGFIDTCLMCDVGVLNLRLYSFFFIAVCIFLVPNFDARMNVLLLHHAQSLNWFCWNCACAFFSSKAKKNSTALMCTRTSICTLICVCTVCYSLSLSLEDSRKTEVSYE